MEHFNNGTISSLCSWVEHQALETLVYLQKRKIRTDLLFQKESKLKTKNTFGIDVRARHGSVLSECLRKYQYVSDSVGFRL